MKVGDKVFVRWRRDAKFSLGGIENG
jgi:hypothetical protein